MTARNAIVAQHPILVDKAEECRFALDSAHLFSLVDFGFVISND
jgi:hypothetical protein